MAGLVPAFETAVSDTLGAETACPLSNSEIRLCRSVNMFLHLCNLGLNMVNILCDLVHVSKCTGPVHVFIQVCILLLWFLRVRSTQTRLNSLRS